MAEKVDLAENRRKTQILSIFRLWNVPKRRFSAAWRQFEPISLRNISFSDLNIQSVWIAMQLNQLLTSEMHFDR